MTVCVYILLLFFGMFTFRLTIKSFADSLNKLELAFYILSIFITAICAGMLFGGLTIFGIGL